MVINTNIEAQATTNNLNLSQSHLAKSLARLSSGSKIIVPSDDAAGLAVSSRLRSQIARLDSSLSNVINAVSFTQTQDGFMKTIDKAYRRMGELAILSQDTTKSDADRALYNQEFQQLKSYVQETTKQDFNGVSLFSGATLDVTVDAEGTTFSMVGINLSDPTYTSATNSGNDAWKLTKDAYMVSKDGYQAMETVYKTSADLWRDTNGEWATTDNGGTKINSGSYVTESKAATADTGATTIAKDNFVAGATVAAGYTVDYDDNQLDKPTHGMSSGDAITFHSNGPGGTVAGTTYYVNKVDADKLTLHSSEAAAKAGTGVINLTRTGALKAPLTNVAGTTQIAAVAQKDTITVTAGNHTGDTFAVTANGNTTAAVASVLNVAQIDTVTIVGDATSAADTFTITINGNAIGPVSFNTNVNTTAANIRTAINNAASVNSAVTATGAGAAVIITSDVPGTAFTTTTSVTQGGGGVTATANKVATQANVDGNAATATAVATAVNGLAGVSAAAVGNVVTVTAGVAGTPMTGATSVALANSDGANAAAPTVATGGTGASVANVVAADSKFTKTDHGYETGDKMVFNGTTPAPATSGTNYYVRKIDANNFRLYDTVAKAEAGTYNTGLNLTTASTTLALEANMIKGNINVTTDEITMVAHGLSSGAKVELTTVAGTPKTQANAVIPSGTSAYVKTITTDTFELYDTAAVAGVFDATKKIQFTAAGNVTDYSFRISVDESSANVIINNKANELKKGMFLTASPITTGEDTNAVLAKAGDIVSIAKTTQDLSAFATEQEADYDDTNLKSVLSSQIALQLVKLAITQVATDRARLGAVQSRLNFTNEQLTVTKENLSAAISRIADVDVAEEATSYARYQILVQSGVEMLKQANQLPQSALNLLR